MVVSRVHRVVAAGALLALGLGSSGCGGSSNAIADAGKTASVSPSAASTSASPSPTKKPKAEPLSRFEGDPAVKVARAWAAAVARDINARSHSLARARKYELSSDNPHFAYSVYEEFDKYYPGPVPFTPVAVTRDGASRKVTTCLWAGGFARTRRGGPRATKHSIVGIEFTARRAAGSWKLTDVLGATVDCAGVKVEGVLW